VTNVTGDAVVTLIVAGSEGQLGGEPEARGPGAETKMDGRAATEVGRPHPPHVPAE
jgi:Na+/H+-dicarboxylate symporter